MGLMPASRRADRLSDRLPWAAMIRDGVVITKDGAFLQTLQFRGLDLDSATPSELIANRARINQALRPFWGSRWALFWEADRHPAQHYPASTFPDPVTALIEDERRRHFEAEGAHLETDTYLTLVYLPPEQHAATLADLLYENQPPRSGGSYARELDTFLDRAGTLAATLRLFLPLARVLDGGALLTYLHGTVSVRRHPVAVPEPPVYLDALLADSDLLGGIHPRLGGQWLRPVSIRAYPPRTLPGLLDALNRVPFPLRLCARWLALDRTAALAEMARLSRHWFGKRKNLTALVKEALTKTEADIVNPDAVRKAEDITTAAAILEDDAAGAGWFTPVVVVAGDTPDALAERVRQVQQVIDALGFVSQPETINAVDAWLGTVPGNAYANVRRALVTSLSLCDLLPLSAVWAGPERNAHLGGPVLLHADTVGATPFRLSTHAGDVGMGFVAGPTGAGKSTLLTLMAAQFRRYPEAQIYLFDKGGSARCLTLAVGGRWYDLSGEGGLCFQPLAGIDDPAEAVWAQEWLLDLIGREGVAVTPARKGAVWEALANLAQCPRSERTLTVLQAMVQEPAVKQALATYTLAGQYGALLDQGSDDLGDESWQCFELDRLMAARSVLIPVLTYLFHRLEQRLTGRPSLIVIDEAWRFLAESVFARRIEDWLKTLRKKNAAVWFATQSLEDIAASPIAPTLLQNCPTQIYLPNPRALDPQIVQAYQAFGFNDRQIELIATAIPKRQYYCRSVAGNRLFDLPLHPAALAFCGASTPADHQAMDRLLAEHGTAGFAERWLQHKGVIPS